MRIDKLRLMNFNGFASCEIGFDPHFNLLVGDNAAGKTTLLDALAIALDSWVLGIKGDERGGGILPEQVRLVPHPFTDSTFFEKQYPSRIEVSGQVSGKQFDWARELTRDGGRTTSVEARNLARAAVEAASKVREGKSVLLPLICSYGTERLWYESRHSKAKKTVTPVSGLPSRLDGYRDCNQFEIQETELLDWIAAEFSVSQQRGKETIAYKAITNVIINCLEGATSLYFNERVKELVIVIAGQGEQMFTNLSDGYRVMLTLVGDLVRRAATLNPQLDDQVLEETPGVVLIDELDLHLHPKWQRRVIRDLKCTFPSMQFIATTHSPQLIGEARPEEIRVLGDGMVATPPRSFGIDSSRILQEVMHASSRNEEVQSLLYQLSDKIDEEDLPYARLLVSKVASVLGDDDPEVTGANTLITFLDSTK